MIHIIYTDNTSTVELRRLVTSVDREYVNNAVVTMILQTKAGAPVGGQAWPITLVYIPNSQGRYVASFSHLTEIQPNTEYDAVIHAVLPNGSEAKWIETAIARERGRQSQVYI